MLVQGYVSIEPVNLFYPNIILFLYKQFNTYGTLYDEINLPVFMDEPKVWNRTPRRKLARCKYGYESTSTTTSGRRLKAKRARASLGSTITSMNEYDAPFLTLTY